MLKKYQKPGALATIASDSNIDLSAFSPDVSNFQLSLVGPSVLDDQSSVKFLRQWPRHLKEGCRIVHDYDYFVHPEG